MNVFLTNLIRDLTSGLTRSFMASVNAVYRDVHDPDRRASELEGLKLPFAHDSMLAIDHFMSAKVPGEHN
jgi:hypothetical protein